MSNRLILGENQYYSLNCHETGLNNNVLVVGASGAGKTRGYVIPNLMETSGSYVVSDPKGSLYRDYGLFFRKRGYEICKLDFTDPSNSAHYNFFNYIRTTQDINKLAHMIANNDKVGSVQDPFWDRAAELLVGALIAYAWETCGKSEQTLATVLKLSELILIDENDSSARSPMDILMDDLETVNSNSYAVKLYKKVRVAAGKTLKSIVITLNSRIAMYDSPEIQEMTAYDDINITSIGQKKRAVFVVVSDNDRSLDGLVNLFFTQAMNELCYFADKKCKNCALPIPVRFILDDFATNCKIDDFPRMIASIRSRGISAMLMIQSEGQLAEGYNNDSRTIIANCDSYVYLGGNDVETAESVAKRCDLPLKKILNMPVGTNWIFRRGQAPINGSIIKLESYLERNPARAGHNPRIVIVHKDKERDRTD